MKQEFKNSHSDRLVRSFGRIKSRKLSDHKSRLLEELLPKYKVGPNHPDRIKKYNNSAIEIGFGFGDFIFEKAKNNPDTIFVGFEPHINGVVNLLSKLEKEPLENILISSEDFRVWFSKQTNLPLFNHIFILFPDPWPKFKHFKRRLVNQDFFDQYLARISSPNALLTIATDHDSYKTWILSEVLKINKFNWAAQSKKDWQIFPNNWIETKYQKKAKREGRVSVIFNLTRNQNA